MILSSRKCISPGHVLVRSQKRPILLEPNQNEAAKRAGLLQHADRTDAPFGASGMRTWGYRSVLHQGRNVFSGGQRANCPQCWYGLNRDISAQSIVRQASASYLDGSERHQKIAVVEPQQFERVKMLLAVEEIAGKQYQHTRAAGEIDIRKHHSNVDPLMAHIHRAASFDAGNDMPGISCPADGSTWPSLCPASHCLHQRRAMARYDPQLLPTLAEREARRARRQWRGALRLQQ
jgi:hypothetical protein